MVPFPAMEKNEAIFLRYFLETDQVLGGKSNDVVVPYD